MAEHEIIPVELEDMSRDELMKYGSTLIEHFIDTHTDEENHNFVVFLRSLSRVGGAA